MHGLKKVRIFAADMKFERIIEGKDHLWAVRDMNKPNNELAALFQKWNDAEYLWEFFMENLDDQQENFHNEPISEAVEDTIDDAEQLERLILEMPYTENLDELFHPLGSTDLVIRELTREKARNWERTDHVSWLRVYAIRVEKNVFVITGGAIKLTHTMQDRAHTQEELGKLNQCRQYLLDNGVFDSDSFISMIEEN